MDNWLLHYNPYMELWFAFHREDYHAYWNGLTPTYPILKSKTVQTLEHMINTYSVEELSSLNLN